MVKAVVEINGGMKLEFSEEEIKNIIHWYVKNNFNYSSIKSVSIEKGE